MNQKVRAFAQDPQRIAARAVFGAMLALLLVLVLLPLGSSMAQATTEIQIINPHESTSLIISDKDRPYHLNSWVNEVPPSPIVEYEIIDGDGNPTTIGTATQQGTDTFEFFWNIDEAVHPDGTYLLRATLFTQGTGTTPTEVARDEQEVILNNGGDELPGVPDPSEPAETVEIVYPVNAGPLGVYVTPGETQESSFIMEVQTSSNNRFVRGFYSTTERGTEPQFKACGGFRNVDTTTRALTFECTVAPADFALGITAVAAVTNDTPSPATSSQANAEFTDAADAHSVSSYFQRPGSVVVEPQSIGDAALGSCVTFTATVRDQNARPIANMNMDAHGVGPDDNLRFDTGTDTSSNSNDTKAPEENHSATEPAFECAFAPNSDTDPSDSGAPEGAQGEHQDPLGPDRKHVESVTGTDVLGSFPFSLRSAAAGTTQVTIWADADNDDQYCSQEQAAAASIGWGQAAPSPVLEAAEVSTCSVAEPSPSPSPTPTATDASPSGDPSGEPSPDPSGEPSPDPSGEPGEECPGFSGDSRNQIVGTPDDDQIEGTEGDDIICGLGGNDTITGLGGDDVILGGDGNDIIRGDEGNDDLQGEDGKDDIRGNAGNDTIDGGLQNDVMLGNTGNDLLIGRSGDDIARGGGGADVAKGGGGKDTLKGGKGGDELRGGGGKDTLSGGAGKDELRGGKGDDLLKGGARPDRLFGGGGRDTCDGGGGNDQLKSCEA